MGQRRVVRDRKRLAGIHRLVRVLSCRYPVVTGEVWDSATARCADSQCPLRSLSHYADDTNTCKVAGLSSLTRPWVGGIGIEFEDNAIVENKRSSNKTVNNNQQR